MYIQILQLLAGFVKEKEMGKLYPFKKTCKVKPNQSTCGMTSKAIIH